MLQDNLLKAKKTTILQLPHQSFSHESQTVLYNQNADWVPAGLNDSGHFFTLETIKNLSEVESYDEEEQQPSSIALNELKTAAQYMTDIEASHLLLL